MSKYKTRIKVVTFLSVYGTIKKYYRPQYQESLAYFLRWWSAIDYECGYYLTLEQAQEAVDNWIKFQECGITYVTYPEEV